MKRNIFKTILLSACILQGGSALAQQEKAEPGKFSPTWESLSQYEVPEWFRNAKFGIWAHWGPQCQPEAGDWYGRDMYEEGGAAYKWHLEHYGHPSEFGFKDVINEWKAEKWNPERLASTITIPSFTVAWYTFTIRFCSAFFQALKRSL